MDPLAEKYPGWSPYVYGFDNPLRFVDPTGMQSEESQRGGFLSSIWEGIKSFFARFDWANKLEEEGYSEAEIEEMIVTEEVATMKAGGLPTSGQEIGVRLCQVAKGFEGYYDFNFSAGSGVGVTGGLIVSSDGTLHPYVGGGAMFGPGAGITYSKSKVIPGLNVGVQGGKWVGVQRGISLRNQSHFWEYGLVSPGASFTIFYVW